jgi:hypothetical protein
MTDKSGPPSWCGFSGILTPGMSYAGSGQDADGRVRFTFTSDPLMDRTATLSVRRNSVFGQPSEPIDVTTVELPPSKETSVALVLYLKAHEVLRIDNDTPVIVTRRGDAHLTVECLAPE